VFGEENSFIGRRNDVAGETMKCIYFLTPTIASTDQVSADLHAVGVKDFYLHVVCRDQAGLKRHQIHSSNYFETLDVVRDGFIGAALGFLFGLAGVGLLLYTKPFGDHVVPQFVYAILVGVATLFGAWEGGLVGIDSENKKLAKFHDDLIAGKYLILVYVRKHREQDVLKMMREKHPDAELVAIDSHFVNPFSDVRRVSAAAAQGATPARGATPTQGV
jgi:hypothetical protein